MSKASLQIAMCTIRVCWQVHEEVEVLEAPCHVKQINPASSTCETDYGMLMCGGVAYKKIRFVALWKPESLWKSVCACKNRKPGTPPIHKLPSWESIRSTSTLCLIISGLNTKKVRFQGLLLWTCIFLPHTVPARIFVVKLSMVSCSVFPPRCRAWAASRSALNRTPDICRAGFRLPFLSPWRDACAMCAVKWLVLVRLFFFFFFWRFCFLIQSPWLSAPASESQHLSVVR